MTSVVRVVLPPSVILLIFSVLAPPGRAENLKDKTQAVRV